MIIKGQMGRGADFYNRHDQRRECPWLVQILKGTPQEHNVDLDPSGNFEQSFNSTPICRFLI